VNEKHIFEGFSHGKARVESYNVGLSLIAGFFFVHRAATSTNLLPSSTDSMYKTITFVASHPSRN